MKATVLLITLSILGWSLAYPSIDWSKIKPKNIYVKELEPALILEENGGKIIGGHETVPNSTPYMAAILVNGNTFCGASLVATGWVLTAAHCVDQGAYVMIILGAHIPLEIESTQVVVTSNNIIIHPSWSPNTLMHDVALIRLPLAVPLNSVIKTIPIAPANSVSYAGATAVLTGWGYTSDNHPGLSNVLQQVDLQIISTNECREYAGIWAYETNICTAGFSGNKNVGSCFGDSGSPLVVQGVQVGIVSFGSERCESGSITSYARVSSYANWIESYIK